MEEKGTSQAQCLVLTFFYYTSSVVYINEINVIRNSENVIWASYRA
jgi:hypothetical protein